MKVILKTDMDALGLEGDTVEVAKGYARNYLIPKGFALEATNQNIKLMETLTKKIDARRIKAKENAEKIKEVCTKFNIPVIGKIPFSTEIYKSVENQQIFTESYPDHPISDVFRNIIEKIS